MTGLESLPLLPWLSIGTAGGGTWVTLNGRWQDRVLSTSFQPLAADSLIKIIKLKGGSGGWCRGDKSEVQLQFLGGGHTSGVLFQLASFLSLGRVSAMTRMQGHTNLTYISSKMNMPGLVRAQDGT